MKFTIETDKLKNGLESVQVKGKEQPIMDLVILILEHTLS